MSNMCEQYKNVNKTARTSESILAHIRMHESDDTPDQDIVLRGGIPRVSGSRTGTEDK